MSDHLVPETLSGANLRSTVAERGTIVHPWSIPVAGAPTYLSLTPSQECNPFDAKLRAELLSLESAAILDALADGTFWCLIDLRRIVVGSRHRLTWQSAYRTLMFGSHCSDPIFGWDEEIPGVNRVRLLVTLPQLIERVCGTGSSAAVTERSTV